ncbi:MAG: putative transport system permease protein [Actinomycetota bacterium]|jgi:putative ABC transport system permease protein|nr:putative transport system permease protein [Actinomycetota bacterium]
MTALATIFRRVNLRHLRAHVLRSSLTLAGIAAGVALLFSISVINATLLASFRASVRAVAGDAELEVAGADASGLPASTQDLVAATPGVDRAVPVLRTMTELTGSKGKERVLVLGVTPDIVTLFPKTTPLGGQLENLLQIDGGFGQGGEGLVLSESVADDLGLGQGSPAVVETPSGDEGLVVSGALTGGAVDGLNGGAVGVMLLPAAQQTFDRVDRLDSVYVVVDPTSSPDDVAADLTEELGGSAIVGPPGQRGRGLERVFASLGTLLSMGGTVALFVSLFVVYNTMSMSLAERRREISMTLALGARPKDVFGAFLMEAALLGALATALGLGAGLLLARVLVLQAVDDFRVLSINSSGPLAVHASHYVIATASGLAVSVAGAFIPARRALSVPAVESLRPVAAYEWEPHAHRFGGRVSAYGGIGGIAVAGALLAAFIVFPEQHWIVTVGLLCGLAGVSFLLPFIVPLAVRILRPAIERAFGAVGRLATDALSKNPRRTTFTVAALVLTLGLVVGVATALGSYETQIHRTASALIGAPIYVTANSFTGLSSDQPIPERLGPELEKVDGVTHAYPLRFALIDLDGETALVYAIPVKSAIEGGATTELGAITDDPQGFLDGLSKGGVIASRLTSERLGVEEGDRISLPTPEGARSFEVAGLFDDLLSFNSFYMDRAVYERFWKDDVADEFGVLLEPGADVETVRARLEDVIRAEDAPATTFSKDELVGRILTIVGGTFDLARGVQLAALVVAVLTIANTMFTAVLERRWEMGLERALGMGSSQLSRTVLVESSTIGLIGGIGGAILGMISGFFMTQAMEAEFNWRIPFILPGALVALSVLGGLVLAACAGLGPSRLAVRAPIIESLRFE